jgi:hypothetical protein
MAAFVESANEKNQCDIILTKLIDSVAEFGNSGLISGDDENTSKVTIDNLSSSLGALKSGGK